MPPGILAKQTDEESDERVLNILIFHVFEGKHCLKLDQPYYCRKILKMNTLDSAREIAVLQTCLEVLFPSKQKWPHKTDACMIQLISNSFFFRLNCSEDYPNESLTVLSLAQMCLAFYQILHSCEIIT